MNASSVKSFFSEKEIFSRKKVDHHPETLPHPHFAATFASNHLFARIVFVVVADKLIYIHEKDPDVSPR